MQLFIYILASALLAAVSNLWVRKSIDVMHAQGDPFAVSRLLVTGVFIALAGIISSGNYAFDMSVLIIGSLSGIFLGLLMWAGARAVSAGPVGLSIAIVNSACIMPPLVMALLFGNKYGHTFTVTNALGNCLVLLGLFLASRSSTKGNYSTAWLIWIGVAFLVHVLLLSSLQWRALLLRPEIGLSKLIPFKLSQATADSFGLIMATVAALLLYALPIKQSETKASWRTIAWYGILGGAINGIANYFTLKATEVAKLSWEKALIFPLYCVLLIAFCSVWSNKLYNEKIEWFALFLCFSGIALSLS